MSEIDYAILQDDLREMLVALGMNTNAQPKSPHEVFQDALGVLRSKLARSGGRSERCMRFGTFDVDFGLIKHHPERVLPLMASGIIVVRADWLFTLCKVRYVAVSDHFEPCDFDEEPFRYEAICNDDGGSITVSWQRVPVPALRSAA